MTLEMLINALKLRKRHADGCDGDRARLWFFSKGKLTIIWDRDGHDHP